MGRLKSALYACLEQMSFRSGAAAAAGVVAVAGLTVTLAVLLGGQRPAVTGAPGTATRATASTGPASPSARTLRPRATRSAASSAAATPAVAAPQQGRSPSQVTVVTTPQALPSFSPVTAMPRHADSAAAPWPRRTGHPPSWYRPWGSAYWQPWPRWEPPPRRWSR